VLQIHFEIFGSALQLVDALCAYTCMRRVGMYAELWVQHGHEFLQGRRREQMEIERREAIGILSQIFKYPH